MMNFLARILLALLAVSQVAFAQTSPSVKEVFSDGYGRDVNEAAQNAAQNALSQVVGSFMDANKILEKQTKIQDGIRTQTRQVRVDIKEYSQGAIQRFEIIEVRQEQFVRVRARVLVRIDDFRVYIRKLAEAEVQVDPGLFAQLRTEDRQNKNAAGILHDNVLAPIVSGEAVRFQVGRPVPFSQLNLPGNLRIVQRHGSASVVGFEVEAALDPGFEENMTRSLSGIARSREEGVMVQGSSPGRLAHLPNYDPSVDISVAVEQRFSDLDGQVQRLQRSGLTPEQVPMNLQRNYTVYIVADSRRDIAERSVVGQVIVKGTGRGKWGQKEVAASGNFALGSLVVELKDASGAVLQSDRIGPESAGRHGRAFSEYLEVMQSRDAVGYYAFPWSLAGLATRGAVSIRPKARFLLLVAVGEEALRRTASIVVRLAP